MASAFVGIGSNIDPQQHILAALRLLRAQTRVVEISTVYQTPAEADTPQPAYYNAVVEMETTLPPQEFKERILHQIEEALGRQRTADKSAPRSIDLDLLLYGDMVFNSADLHIPDPLITRRAFLAIPLAEIAPNLRLPDTGQRICEVADDIKPDGMQPLPDFTDRARKVVRGELPED